MKEVVFYVAPILSLLGMIMLCIRPLWGVIVLFCARPLIDGTWDQSVIGDFKLTEIVSSVVPLMIFARMLLDAGARRPVKDMPLKWIWLLLSADALRFSTMIMIDHDWREGLQVLFRHLNGVVGFYMVQAYCRDERDFLRFAWGLVVMGFFPMATGLYEAMTGFHWRFTIGPSEVVRDIGLYHDAITIRLYTQEVTIGLLFVWVLSRRSHLLTVFCVVYALIATYVMKGAYSKSGWLTLGLWLALWPILRKSFKGIITLALGGLIAAAYFSAELSKSIFFVFQGEIAAAQGNLEVNQTLEGRFDIWQDMAREWDSLNLTAQLLGSGHGANGAHNDYLQVLFSGGLIALALYVLLLVAAGWSILRLLVKRADIWAIGALFVYLLWMVDTVGLTPSAYSTYQWFVWGIIGFCLRHRNDERVRIDVPVPVAPPRFANLMGAT